VTAAKPALPKALKAIIWVIFAEGLVVASLAAVLLADILLGNINGTPRAYLASSAPALHRSATRDMSPAAEANMSIKQMRNEWNGI
jgi:hypothetical protein